MVYRIVFIWLFFVNRSIPFVYVSVRLFMALFMFVSQSVSQSFRLLFFGIEFMLKEVCNSIYIFVQEFYKFSIETECLLTKFPWKNTERIDLNGSIKQEHTFISSNRNCAWEPFCTRKTRVYVNDCVVCKMHVLF